MSCRCSKEKNSKSKHITVYLNGFRTEKKHMVLNPKNLKWYHILNDITNKIQPYFGHVRKLYSSESGITICSFTDIKDNGTYVASDNKKYQLLKGGYDNKIKEKIYEHYLTEQLNRSNRIKKLSFVRRDLIVIYVFNNGKNRTQPVKFVLSKEDLQNWAQTLTSIALSIDVPRGCIKGLYNSNGHKLCGPCELQHGASYIAVSYNEKFIPKNYKIREDITEIWKSGIPIVYRNKNELCYERLSKKYRQNLEWKHYVEDLYDYSSMEFTKRPKFVNKCKNKKVATDSSCLSSSSSESTNVNIAELFFMPSDKCGFLSDQNSKLKKPLSTSYEKTLYANKLYQYSCQS